MEAFVDGFAVLVELALRVVIVVTVRDVFIELDVKTVDILTTRRRRCGWRGRRGRLSFFAAAFSAMVFARLSF